MKKSLIKEILFITVAMFIISADIYFIMMPSNLVIGSMSGLAMVISTIVPVPVSVVTLIINGLLLLMGYILIGSEFGGKTVYTTLLLPFYLWIFEHIAPNVSPLTDEVLINVISYILLMSLGQALLFRINASSGGLDIVAKLLNKYFYVDLGDGVTIGGFVIATSSVFVYDIKTLVISLIGTYFNGIILNDFIGSFNIRKKVCVITKEYDKVNAYVHDELNRTCTLYTAIGGSTRSEVYEVAAILTRNEYGQLLTYLQKEIPDAFVTVYNVGEVFGRWNDNRRRKKNKQIQSFR